MDLKQISELVAAVCGSRTVTELTLREGASRLVIRRALAMETRLPEAGGGAVAENAPESFAVRSPLVGIFHGSASAKHPPVAVGTPVQEGQVLGAIESMRMLYDVTADVSGVVVEALVEDGQPVEYAQELFRIQLAQDATHPEGV
jgi:biotin carboxyl carrier protein